jgi:CRP/FNR family transcriptional regulator
MLPDGRRQILAFALPGDFLGMPLAARHDFSADAIGEVALCQLSRDDLTKFIQSRPNIMRRLIEFATRELEMAQNQLLLLGNGSAEEKVAIFLVSWRNRLARLTALSETVPLPMRRQDIADFLGLKLETVSRTLAKLEHRKVIRVIPKGVFLTGLEQTLLVKGRSYQPDVRSAGQSRRGVSQLSGVTPSPPDHSSFHIIAEALGCRCARSRRRGEK